MICSLIKRTQRGLDMWGIIMVTGIGIVTTDSAYLLGTTGFNVYSGLQYDDSIFYFGNYPSGALLLWNKNRQWTAQKFINGGIVGGKKFKCKSASYWVLQKRNSRWFSSCTIFKNLR